MEIPSNWKHKSGYRLNADGKSIEYEHTERPFVAIVEAMVNEQDHTLDYYTVIFDQSTKPMATVEGHELFGDKESAKDNLYYLMEKHN